MGWVTVSLEAFEWYVIGARNIAVKLWEIGLVREWVKLRLGLDHPREYPLDDRL